MFIVGALSVAHYTVAASLAAASFALVVIILVQRGRGGGLMFANRGGTSVFSPKAGDRLTSITMGVAAVWAILSIVALRILK